MMPREHVAGPRGRKRGGVGAVDHGPAPRFGDHGSRALEQHDRPEPGREIARGDDPIGAHVVTGEARELARVRREDRRADGPRRSVSAARPVVRRARSSRRRRRRSVSGTRRRCAAPRVASPGSRPRPVPMATAWNRSTSASTSSAAARGERVGTVVAGERADHELGAARARRRIGSRNAAHDHARAAARRRVRGHERRAGHARRAADDEHAGRPLVSVGGAPGQEQIGATRARRASARPTRPAPDRCRCRRRAPDPRGRARVGTAVPASARRRSRSRARAPPRRAPRPWSRRRPKECRPRASPLPTRRTPARPSPRHRRARRGNPCRTWRRSRDRPGRAPAANARSSMRPGSRVIANSSTPTPRARSRRAGDRSVGAVVARAAHDDDPPAVRRVRACATRPPRPRRPLAPPARAPASRPRWCGGRPRPSPRG